MRGKKRVSPDVSYRPEYLEDLVNNLKILIPELCSQILREREKFFQGELFKEEYDVSLGHLVHARNEVSSLIRTYRKIFDELEEFKGTQKGF